MQPGKRRVPPLALSCCLLLVALTSCARFRSDPPERRTPSPPIAVSVSAGSIYLVDAGTGTSRELVGGLGDFQSGYATWSPDHRRLAFGRDGIYLAEPAGNRERGLVRGAELTMPAWSPDATTLAYSDGLSIWITELANVRPERVHVPAVLAPLALAWTPADRIAFEGLDLDCTPVVRCVSTGTSDIWTIRPDGTGLSKVTDVGHAEHPKWSSDGTAILYVRHYKGAQRPSEIWEVTGNGFQSRRVLAMKDLVAADWSPDGRQIAIVRASSRGGSLELWIGGADGSTLRQVAEFPGTHATVDW